MATSQTASRDERNWILAGLTDASYTRVAALCERVPVPHKAIVIHPDEPIAHAYFPQSGCLSMVTLMEDGNAVEVGTIGWEGMSGASLIHGVASVPTQCLAQVAGEAKRIPRDAFERELRENEEFRDVLHRYAQVWTDQVGRAGSCNGVHTVEERLARWLLMTHDRVDSDVVPLTQEFLAIMLAVRRASVTLAASSLQQAGLIEYRRGRISVVDREALETASCECYSAMRAMYAARLPVRAVERNGVAS